MEVWDVYTRKQFSQYQEAAKKNVLLDPQRRELYLRNKKEQERLERLVKQMERRKSIMY